MKTTINVAMNRVLVSPFVAYLLPFIVNVEVETRHFQKKSVDHLPSFVRS